MLDLFGPVVLALFCLTLSLIGIEFLDGFDEGQPATWLSVGLMAVCLALTVRAVFDATIERAKRRTALVLAVVLVLALLDESLSGHEFLGDFVRDNLDVFSRNVRRYTDDVLILLGTLVVALLLYRCLRSVSDRDRYRWHLVLIVGLAFAHGLLDVLSHGRHMGNRLQPVLTPHEVGYLVDVLGYFEEACKLWTEWFVFLFLMEFFYRRRAGLLWSAELLAGSTLAAFGVWGLRSVETGVPYLVLGGSLDYIRNQHLLVGLALVWIPYTLAVWRAFGEDPRRRAIAGLFFLTPMFLLLPRMTLLDALAPPRPSPVPNGWEIVATVVAAALALAGWRARARIGTPGAVLAAVPLGLVGFSATRLVDQPVLLLAVGGLLLPTLALQLARRQRWTPSWLATAAVIGLLVQNPLWWIVALAILLIHAVPAIEALSVGWSRRRWAVGVGLQLATIVLMLIVARPTLLPRDEYDMEDLPRFSVGRKAVIERHPPW